MPVFRGLIFLLACFSLLGCSGDSAPTNRLNPPETPDNPGDSDNSDNPDTPDKPETPLDVEKVFPLQTLWGQDAPYRNWDATFRQSIERIAYRPSDSVTCYILNRLENQQQDVFEPDSELSCLNDQGEVIFQQPTRADTVLKDIQFSANGHLTIAALVYTDDVPHPNMRYRIQTTQLDPQWQVLNQAMLQHTPQPSDLYFYQLDDNNDIEREIGDDLAHNGFPMQLRWSFLKLAFHGDTPYLLANTFGITLYQLNDKLQPTWAHQVMPGTDRLYRRDPARPQIQVSPSGNIVVGYSITHFENKMARQHFQTALPAEFPMVPFSLDTLIDVIDTNGQSLQRYRTGIPNYDENVAYIRVKDDDEFVLVSNIRHKKHQTPGNTTEWDVLIARIDADTGYNQSHAIVDHMQEDIVERVSMDNEGNYLLAGRTDYQQVDSNSVVSYPKGMLLKVNEAGQLLASTVLRGPRAVDIRDVHWLEDGRVMFGGVYNSFITHTCDNDDSLCYEEAMLGITSLSAP